jgi:hypothetical protein
MNERIKELGRQAGLYMEPQHPGGFPNEELAVAERFAELIVKECCDIADDWYQNHNDIHWDPAQHIKNCFGIGKQFGVEE